MKQKKAYLSTLKWGGVLGVLLALFEVVKMYARRVDYSGAKVLDLALVIGFVLVLYAGIKEFKELYTERLSFAKAFLGCILISLVGSAILLGYDMLHYTVIEKDGLQRKYTVALEKYKQNLAKDTLTADELTAYTEAATALLDEHKASLLGATGLQGFAGQSPDTDTVISQQIRDEISSGILLFQKFYADKLRSKPETDKEEYQLGKFTSYARRVMMETLVSYTEQNDGKASTPYVQGIVQQTNETIAGLDPLEKRFEETKSHVPRYDRNGQYAAVSAMMYLLYGMFFGLFVAMFHYTSKNPIEESVPSETDEDEQL